MKKITLMVVLVFVALLFLYFLYPKTAYTHAEFNNPTGVFADDAVLKANMASEVLIPEIKVVKTQYKASGLLDRIIMCESGGNPTARNSHSTAKGLAQFLDSSWRYYGLILWGSLEGKDVFNPNDNRELASFVLRRYGTSSWSESRSCWS